MKRFLSGTVALGLLGSGIYLMSLDERSRELGSARISETSVVRSQDAPLVLSPSKESPSTPLSPPLSKPEVLKPENHSLSVAIEESQAARRRQEALKEAVAADPHATPNLVIQSGRKLGEIAELEKNNPELKVQIQKFYLDCLEDTGAITVTRVQCIDYYVKSRGLTQVETDVLIKDLPLSIRKLYSRYTARK